MDFIQKCFDEFNTALLGKLEEAGIKGDLAKHFLHETAHAIVHNIRDTSLDKTIEILLSSNPSQLLNTLNITDISEQLGMTDEQVSVALEAITPVITRAFTVNSNELVAATASLAWKTTDESICMEDQLTTN